MIEDELLPSVSVIIPAKNEEEYIGRCLEAVSNLEYPKDKVDFFVIDNKSSDQTIQYARKFTAVEVLETEGTISAVRNLGGQQAKGEILAFLDADCIPDRKWLLNATKTLIEKDDVAVVGAVLKVEEKPDVPWIEKYWLEYLNTKFCAGLNYVSTISSFCFLVRRKAMNDVNWFNENLETCEDSDLGYRISQNGDKLVIDENIKTVHLRNAKTIRQFFLRQLWQGGSNLQNLFQHNFEWSELPSVIIPMAYLLLLIVSPITFFSDYDIFKYTITGLVIALPMVITIRSGISILDKRFPGFTLIWFLYLLGRGLGMIIKISSSSK
jgi:cellulose synthase/poly-beta-1,6-N-acetylglucosamine synthase-like glycosyltransferase